MVWDSRRGVKEMERKGRGPQPRTTRATCRESRRSWSTSGSASDQSSRLSCHAAAARSSGGMRSQNSTSNEPSSSSSVLCTLAIQVDRLRARLTLSIDPILPPGKAVTHLACARTASQRAARGRAGRRWWCWAVLPLAQPRSDSPVSGCRHLRRSRRPRRHRRHHRPSCRHLQHCVLGMWEKGRGEAPSLRSRREGERRVHPERLVNGGPALRTLPWAAWINPPTRAATSEEGRRQTRSRISRNVVE